ncbi:MAG: tetratricopeptide repeat protein [bacterium]
MRPTIALTAAIALGCHVLAADDSLNRARALKLSGENRAAAKLLKQMLETEPENAAAMGLLGDVLSGMDAEKAAKAVPFLARAIELSPDEPDNFTALCRAYRKMGAMKYREAFRQCRKSMELDATRWPVYGETGFLYEADGNMKKAVEILKMGAEIAPEDYRAFYRLGLAYLKTGGAESSERALKKAFFLAGGKKTGIPASSDMDGIKLALKKAAALKRAAEGTVKKKRRKSGGKQKAAENKARVPRAKILSETEAKRMEECLTVSRQAEIQGDLPGAESGFRKCLDMNPADGGARVSLAGVLLRKDSFDKAEKEFETALNLLDAGDPLVSYCHSRLGDILVRQGKTGAAARHYAGALKLNSGDASALAGLGRCREAESDLNGAAEYYLKALETQPNNMPARTGLERVDKLSMNQDDILAEMKERMAIDSGKTVLTKEDLALFSAMREAESGGAVDFVKQHVRSLSRYVMEKKVRGGRRVRLMLNMPGYQLYLRLLDRDAVRVFGQNGVSAKFVFRLRDMAGRKVFDPSGKLTPEGKAVYEAALGGSGKWLMPDEAVPQDKNTEEGQAVKNLLNAGWIEAYEPEYLWIGRATDCPEDVLEKKLNVVLLKSPGGVRYFVYTRQDKPGWIISTYLSKYRSGNTSITGAVSTGFFGSGSVKNRKLCVDGKIWMGD